MWTRNKMEVSVTLLLMWNLSSMDRKFTVKQDMLKK